MHGGFASAVRYRAARGACHSGETNERTLRPKDEAAQLLRESAVVPYTDPALQGSWRKYFSLVRVVKARGMLYSLEPDVVQERVGLCFVKKVKHRRCD